MAERKKGVPTFERKGDVSGDELLNALGFFKESGGLLLNEFKDTSNPEDGICSKCREMKLLRFTYQNKKRPALCDSCYAYLRMAFPSPNI